MHFVRNNHVLKICLRRFRSGHGHPPSGIRLDQQTFSLTTGNQEVTVSDAFESLWANSHIVCGYGVKNDTGL